MHIRRARIAAVLGALGALLGSCGPPPPRPSLLLITLDTTRADRLGAYGHAAARTPVLDDLAARGLRFERAYAPTPITLPSHTSILTGVLPPAHGVRNNTLFRAAPEGLLVSEVLSAQGWHTGAFVGAFVLAPKFGLDQGFDVYTAPDPAVGEGLERPAADVVDDALEWLSALPPDEPWFAWVHLYDVHSPYEPPAGFDDLADPYDGELAYVDAQLGRLLDGIGQARPGDPPALVVTADHGESLGEHGEETHGVFLYDGTARVPLLVLPAGADAAPAATLDAPVAVRDVAPTLLELAGLPRALLPDAEGPSLLTLTDGGARGEQPIYLETELPFLHHRWQPLRGLVLGDHKLVDSSRPELYDLLADPGETDDLAAREPQRLAALQSRLRQVLERTEALGWSVQGGLHDDDRERLAALGYTGTAGEVEHPELLPLPRDRVGDLPRMRDATVRLQAALESLGTAPGGAAGEVRREAARRALGELRDELQALQAEHPDEPSTLGNLAQTCEALGDLPAALALRQRQARLSALDPRVHSSVALLLEQLGRDDEALDAMRAAAALEPQLPMAFRWLARAHERRGELGRAEGWLRALDAIWWVQGARRDELRREAERLRVRREQAGQALVMPPG